MVLTGENAVSGICLVLINLQDHIFIRPCTVGADIPVQPMVLAVGGKSAYQ